MRKAPSVSPFFFRPQPSRRRTKIGNNELSTIKGGSQKGKHQSIDTIQPWYPITPFEKNSQPLVPAEDTYQLRIKMLRFPGTTLLCFSMKEKEVLNKITMPDDINDRLQVLEEKFEYQERTIDALNEVIIEQQTQLNSLEDQILRLQAMLSTIEDNPNGGEEPPPPHY